MLSESLKKLYNELCSSKESQDQKETIEVKEVKDSEYIKIPAPEIDPITKPVPIDFPRATIPFRTSNAYQIFSEGKNFI